MRHAVFIFCVVPEKDPVAGHVLNALKAEFTLVPTGAEIDGYPVLEIVGLGDKTISIVTTDEVVSNNYARYAPILNDRFEDADVVGIVNWHEGANAPNAIFTVQTTGDLATGTFSRVDPRITRGLLLAIEDERIGSDLHAFQAYLEATHWSGVKVGDAGIRLADLRPSAIDIEIGSSPADWANPIAARVLARALVRTFDRMEEPVQSVLCMGGIHFEPSFTRAVLQPREGLPVAVGHVLPNHWLVSEGYDRESRLVDLRACVHSIVGGIQSIVYHDKLKAPYKGVARLLSEELCVPILSHKKLRGSRE
ncbi:D-aminoacyl-tRNA deacylase [Bradyrhizobium brasilense]|uniref:D-aminoacyl-tRNA deacylase n=1 Tax=Bradyrhizobium brasilense TaxID=1419277 RepID=UPI0024B0496E|nr:D-aminoacyl-tRNA deacylase [Bradyrhizobium australafricanum]WFU31413.1 D-aminoacyl-tRNA deacylase [Bradyrhizobium australafricanum]